MSSSFRAPLLVLAAVLLAGVAVYFAVLRPGTVSTEVHLDPALQPRGTGEPGVPDTPRNANLAPGPASARGPDGAPRRVASPGFGPGGLPLRDLEGVDLSDPEVLQDLLGKALSDRPIDWGRVTQLVSVFEGRLDDATRATLLKQLATGDRVGALRAFAHSRDGTLTADLLRLLDDRDISRPARAAIVRALGALPGANDAEVVLGLEGRLTGVARDDLPLLQSIGRRGGPEAARAIVAYMLESPSASTLPHNGYLSLDLAKDEAAVEVVAAALGSTRDEEKLRGLIRLSAQPGAAGLVAALVDLDRGETSAELRQEVLQALGRIGTQDAVDRLLEVGGQPGHFGEAALTTVGKIRSATTDARAKLVAALDESAARANPRARLEILRALSNLGEASAMKPMAKALADPDVEVQIVGINGLGNMGAAASGHVEDLVSLFSTGTETIQQQVAIALGGIGGPEARSVLSQMLTSDTLSPRVTRSVNLALQRLKQDETDTGSGTRLGGSGR